MGTGRLVVVTEQDFVLSLDKLASFLHSALTAETGPRGARKPGINDDVHFTFDSNNFEYWSATRQYPYPETELVSERVVWANGAPIWRMNSFIRADHWPHEISLKGDVSDMDLREAFANGCFEFVAEAYKKYTQLPLLVKKYEVKHPETGRLVRAIGEIDYDNFVKGDLSDFAGREILNVVYKGSVYTTLALCGRYSGGVFVQPKKD